MDAQPRSARARLARGSLPSPSPALLPGLDGMDLLNQLGPDRQPFTFDPADLAAYTSMPIPMGALQLQGLPPLMGLSSPMPSMPSMGLGGFNELGFGNPMLPQHQRPLPLGSFRMRPRKAFPER